MLGTWLLLLSIALAVWLWMDALGAWSLPEVGNLRATPTSNVVPIRTIH